MRATRTFGASAEPKRLQTQAQLFTLLVLLIARVTLRLRMEINFKADVSSPIPSEIGVTLIRILQEAFHNAAKHSGVKRIDVQLSELSNEVQLTISDSGKGFDTEAAKQSRGLGLTSMEERVRLVKGTITIASKSMHGTNIQVRVP